MRIYCLVPVLLEENTLFGKPMHNEKVVFNEEIFAERRSNSCILCDEMA